MMNEEYGLCEWIRDGIAAGNVFGQIHWKRYADRLTLAVKVIYKTHLNQKWFEKMKFEDVTDAELHRARMRLLQSDRIWREGNLRLAGELARDESLDPMRPTGEEGGVP